MNVTANQQAALTSPRTVALKLLQEARDSVAATIVTDLAKLASDPASIARGEFPEGTPPWLIIVAGESSMPDGSVCWDIARAHLTNLTASRLAYVPINEARAYDLIKSIGLNLYTFAGEFWAGLGKQQQETA